MKKCRVDRDWISSEENSQSTHCISQAEDIKQFLDEVEHDIMNYQTEVCVRQITQTQGFDNS